MRRSIPVVIALIALGAGRADAAIITYSTPLTPEALGATGSGSVEVLYDDVAHTLDISADFTGLSGTTTVAHIHCCTAAPGTGTIGVAVTPGTLPGFPSGVSAATYNVVVDLTQATSYTTGFTTSFGGGTTAGSEAALIAGFNAGLAYFNVHSTTFQGGEIRGFLAQQPAVPEPTSLALLGLGLGVTAIALRRRQRRSV